MALVLRAPGRKLTLTDRLAELGRGRRRAAVASGVFRLAAGSLGLLTALAVLDAAAHLPAVARSAGLALWLVVTLALYLRGVRPAARQSARPQAVAHALERQFPRFNDALATAVDLLTDGRGGSRFRDVTVLRAENLARRVELDVIVPSRRAWAGFWLLAVAAVVAAPLTLADTGRAALALRRLFDPLGDHPWPTKTRLTLLDPAGDASLLARGDAFPVRFTVGGEVPEYATVVVRLSGEEAAEEAVPLALAEGETQVAIDHRLDAGRVPRDFQVRVRAGDAETPWHAVEVAAGPKLVALGGRASPQIDLTFPAYTDLPPARLAAGAGVVEAVAGTRVHFLAAADRPIARAAFVPQFDTAPVERAAAVAAVTNLNPLAALAAQLLGDGLSADIPVHLTGGDFTRLEAAFTPHLPGLYALHFEDGRGLAGTRLIDLRCFPDPSPVVRIERPMAGVDALQLLPTAAFTVQGHAEDRPFAVRSVACEYRTRPDDPWATLMLTDLADLKAPLPAVVGGPLGSRPAKPFALDAGRRVPVAAFRRPDGTALADGDTLTLRLAARDWDDRTALKEPGRSQEVVVRVLSKPSLETALAKALADLRPEALRLEAQQREATAKTADVKRAADAGPLSKEDSAKLAAAEQEQRQLRAKVADATNGMRAQVEQLRRVAEANGMTRSPSADKIQAVAGELNKLADQSLERAEAGLAAAKQAAERPGTPDKEGVAAGLTQAAGSQPAAEASLKAVLEQLEKWGGAGEVRGAAQDLKNEVARAGEQAAKAAAEAGPETPPEELTPAEKVAVNSAAAKLDAAADRAGDLLAKAARIAAEKEAAARKAGADTPDGKQAQAEADALRDAVEAAGGAELPGDLRQSAADTRGQRPNAAEAARQSAQARLDKLADALTEKPPEAPGDALQKKRQQAIEEIDRLAVEQDELRKKAKKVAAQPDGPEKEQALQELAAEQDALRKMAEEVLQRLTRDPVTDDPAAPPPAALRDAARAMEAARDQLERGAAPTAKQDEALDKLDESLDKLERNGRQDGEQLAREERARVAEQLKALRDRQQAAADEAARIDAAALEDGSWGRPLQRSLRDLGDRETDLAAEVEALGEKTFGEKLPVFARLTAQSAAAMRQAAERVTARGDDIANLDPAAAFDPIAEKLAAKRVSRPVALALRRLDQILDAIQPEKPDGEKKPDEQLDRPPTPQGEGGEGGEKPPAGPPPDSVPALAQLKALRAMQLDVKERTAEFAADNPDATKLTADAVAELREIEQAQREIAELFDAVAEQLRAAQMPPIDPDEKE